VRIFYLPIHFCSKAASFSQPLPHQYLSHPQLP